MTLDRKTNRSTVRGSWPRSGASGMLAPERHSFIMSELSRNASVSIKELSKQLGVSRETVRKDLETLAEQSKLNQVRGGAVRVVDLEPPLADRLRTNPAGKAAIAELVVERVGDDASVFIDSGSTTYLAAERLVASRKNLVIYTNDLRIALLCVDHAAEVNLLGGRMDARDSAVYGLEAIDFVRRYRADFALVGVIGINEQSLFTDSSRETAALREAMIACSEKAFILADSSKFGISGRCPVVASNPLTLLTDGQPPENIMKSLKRNKVTVVFSET